MAEKEDQVATKIGEKSHGKVDAQLHSVKKIEKVERESRLCGRKTSENAHCKDEHQQIEESSCDQSMKLLNQSKLQLQTSEIRKFGSTPDISSAAFNNQRVYKKSSPNSKLTLYLASRDLIVSESKIDKLQGVLLIDPEYLQDKRVYGQVTLTFRYGREDEEVMGLKFCNEAIMCVVQLYPPYVASDSQEIPSITPLQEALVKRLGPNAYAFTMEITPLAPPSVQLVPAKEYTGAPIGTSYDVRAYVADRPGDKLHRKATVRMGIRVIQRTTKPPLPALTMYSVPTTIHESEQRTNLHASVKSRLTFVENEIFQEDENTGPHAAVEKPFLLSDGRVALEAKLDRSIYAHGDPIIAHVNVTNNSSKSVRRIKVFVVQHVDVCMFSNGKFKNVVALVSSQEGCPVGPGSTFKKSYTLRPIKGSTKNWIALEDSYTKTGATLASTIVSPGGSLDDRNVFAIYVSYYVKIKLIISAMGGDLSLKLPFALMHSNTDPDLIGFSSPIRELPKTLQKPMESIAEQVDQQDDDNLRNIETKKLSTINKKERENDITNVDLIEHCEEDST